VFPALIAERVFRWEKCCDDQNTRRVTKKIRREPTAAEAPAREMVRRARKQGLSPTGPDGLLK